jgi:hypothetical protein
MATLSWTAVSLGGHFVAVTWRYVLTLVVVANANIARIYKKFVSGQFKEKLSQSGNNNSKALKGLHHDFHWKIKFT